MLSRIETWKDIPGYEGLYQISNYWSIKSLSFRSSSTLIYRDKILKQSKNGPWYLTLALSKEWIAKTVRVHRLVWLLFVENPNNFPCLNHLDWNKENNYYLNLEWCTSSENNLHAYRTWLKKVTDKNIFKTNHPQTWKFWWDSIVAKSVMQYDIDWNFIRTWWSAMDIKRTLWINNNSVSRCCRWEIRTAWWFTWKYINT